MTSFVSSHTWADAFFAADCPIARVAVTFFGASASEVENAVRSYAADLQENKERTGSYDQVFFSGGWSLGINWQDGDYPAVVLKSAGEDGLDSLEFAAQELTDAVVKACPDAVLAFEELSFV